MTRKLLAALAALSAASAFAAVEANHATEAELDSVRGIGPSTTRAILQERRKAPFTGWDDFLARVEGLGDRRAQALSDAGLTVGGRPYPGAKAGPVSAASTHSSKPDPTTPRR